MEQEKLRSDRETPLRKGMDQSDSISIGNEKEPYAEQFDDNCVDPYDEYDDVEPKEDTPIRESAFNPAVIGVIAACVIVFIFLLPNLKNVFVKKGIDGQNVTTNTRSIQEHDEFNWITSTKAVCSVEPNERTTSIPTYTPKPTATATRKPTKQPSPTHTVTAVPTAIPVGTVNINIKPIKSDNGTIVVDYEDDLRLSWHANHACYYDVSLQGAAGNVIVRSTNTSEKYLDITSGNLSTGSYVFFVTAYNSSGIAGSTEKLCFDIVSTNTYTELSDYLGTSLYSFVRSIDGMKDVGATSGVEYSNGTVRAYSPFDLDCIAFIDLERSSNYSICGVSVGQSLEEAANTLSDAGWWIIDKRAMYRDYQDSEGNTIFIWTEDGYTIDSISINLSDDTLADMYPSYFDYDDDWGTYTEDIEMVYTTGDVNIRKGPGKGYSSVGVIKADTVVTYLGNSSVDERGVVWYNILYKGVNGWVSSKYTELG